MPWIESVMNGGNETEKCVDSETSTPFSSTPVSATNDTRCGLQGGKPLVNIGNEAYNGQFPWMVRITVTFWNRQNQTCLGTLIADQWVVTNANCVNFSNFHFASLDFGRFDLSKTTEQENGMRMTSTEIYSHPCFHGWDFDLALVKLPKKINISRNIRPICLPENCDSSVDDFEFEIDSCRLAEIVGWESTKGQLFDHLPIVGNLTVIPRYICNQHFTRNLNQSQICAYGSSWQYEGAAPVMCKNNWNNTIYLLGITSIGNPNRQKRTVFSRSIFF